jgi:hypothetical protein
MRDPGSAGPNRHAANSKRYRLHKKRGEKIFYLAANVERLTDFLVRKRLLPDNRVHSHAEVELALAHWVDDETR